MAANVWKCFLNLTKVRNAAGSSSALIGKHTWVHIKLASENTSNNLTVNINIGYWVILKSLGFLKGTSISPPFHNETSWNAGTMASKASGWRRWKGRGNLLYSFMNVTCRGAESLVQIKSVTDHVRSLSGYMMPDPQVWNGCGWIVRQLVCWLSSAAFYFHVYIPLPSIALHYLRLVESLFDARTRFRDFLQFLILSEGV